MQERKRIKGKNIDRFSFVEHLEELRMRILKILFSVLILTLLIFSFFNQLKVDQFFIRPLKQIQQKLYFYNLLEPLLIRFKISFILGIIVSFPYVIFQTLQFIFPALKEKEKKVIILLLFFILFLFFSGVYFAYRIILPSAVYFLMKWAPPSITPILGLKEYINLYLGIILASGISFLFPVVILILAKVNLIHYKFLWKHVPEALIIILIVAAIITPSPDMVSQIFLTIPLFLLYLLSIGLAYFFREK